MNNEAFYLKLVKMATADENFKKLDDTLEAKDWEGAFNAAHALKGVVGNLELTPLYEVMQELTEKLRPLEPCDCADLLEKVHTLYGKLLAIVNE